MQPAMKTASYPSPAFTFLAAIAAGAPSSAPTTGDGAFREVSEIDPNVATEEDPEARPTVLFIDCRACPEIPTLS